MLTVLYLAAFYVNAVGFIATGSYMAGAPEKYWLKRGAGRRAAWGEEPGDDALQRIRAQGFFALILATLLAFGLVGFVVTMAVGSSSARSTATRAVNDLKSRQHYFRPDAAEVVRAVRDANPFARVRVAATDRYEIANVLGHHPVCLTVNNAYDSGLYGGSSPDPDLEFESLIDDGRC